MKITFLGTSSGTPSWNRNVSAIGLQLVQQGKLWLFDCGEGTQHQVLRSPPAGGVSWSGSSSRTCMAIISTVCPVCWPRGPLSAGASTPVTIYGPNGLNEFLRVVFERSQTRPGYPIHVEVLRPGLVYEDKEFEVVCAPMAHRIESYGFAVIEKTQTGHFDVEQANALGIPPGPIFGRLKRGETVVLPDGRTIDGTTFVGPPLVGRKIVYAGDTGETPRAAELARGALELPIHEATCLPERGCRTGAARCALHGQPLA